MPEPLDGDALVAPAHAGTDQPPRLLTTRGLDQALRQAGAAAVRLSPVCHPAAGVDGTYLGHAAFLLTCHRCHREVARLAIAGGQPRGREDA